MNLRELFTLRLREALERVSVSQRKLATIIGVHPNTVQNWFTGESFPSPEIIEKIAEIAEVSPHWLLGAPEVSKIDQLRFDLHSIINNANEIELEHALSILKGDAIDLPNDIVAALYTADEAQLRSIRNILGLKIPSKKSNAI